MRYADVYAHDGLIGLYKSLEKTAGPDANGKRRKGAVIWAHADPRLSTPPETRLYNGQKVVEVKFWAAAMMHCPTSRSSFVDILRNESESVLALFCQAGLTEDAAAMLLHEAKQAFVAPRDAIITMRHELAAVFDSDPTTIRMRCEKVNGTWIFGRYDGLSTLTGCSEDAA
jgi:hypothetical protein